MKSRSVRMSVYNSLVNKHQGICERYHKVHDKRGLLNILLSYGYLAVLNVRYYCFFEKSLSNSLKADLKDKISVPEEDSESHTFYPNIEKFEAGLKAGLSRCNTVSFDVFDTLIYRYTDDPKMIFELLSEHFMIPNLGFLRAEQERLARLDKCKETGSYEVTLADIWDRIEKIVGIKAEDGIKYEKELELKYCHANEYMLGVFNKIKDQGYRIIITSDMYLDSDFITQVLNKNGYSGFSNVYISGEINKSKAQGDLYDYIKDQEPGNSVFIHIGDNQVSDVENASSHGFIPVKYENADSAGSKFRPADMSYIIGSAYRGIINHRMYSGIDNYSEEYEYGYIYGGLFVYGYCNYIHNYCKTNDIDKIIFLARDGDILKEIYDRIFPGENTEYALWSRAIGVKLMAGTNRYDYFRRFLTHKANKDYTVYEILESMELGEYASKWFDKPDEIVFTSGMEKDVRKVLTEHFHEITDKYKKEDISAKRVWEKRLDGCKRAVAVDIGWAGTGAISIKHLVENKWNIPCKIYGMLAGTNTVYNDEPNASEFYLADGILDSYLFSQSKNRDILKRHDPNRNMNVYWEILLSSEQKHFTGYDINENDEIVEKFDDEPIYEFGIKQVKTGIRDFCSDYSKLCRINGMFMDISGRDAAAPMLALLNGNDKYLKRINDKFNLKTEV